MSKIVSKLIIITVYFSLLSLYRAEAQSAQQIEQFKQLPKSQQMQLATLAAPESKTCFPYVVTIANQVLLRIGQGRFPRSGDRSIGTHLLTPKPLAYRYK